MEAENGPLLPVTFSEAHPWKKDSLEKVVVQSAGGKTMAMIQHPVAVSVFREEQQARKAIDELLRAGFSADEIGFLARVRDVNTQGEVTADTTRGMVEGSVVGGVLGTAASLLIPGFGPAVAGGVLAATFSGATLGAATGGLVGSFRGLGISEHDAHFYQRALEAGHTIVTVKTPDATGYNDALSILRSNGAYDASTHEGIVNATAPIRSRGTTEHEETRNPDAPGS
jgi:hypothetical protein